MKWAIKLAEFGLRFVPRHAIKNQSLANFFAEWTPVNDFEHQQESSSPTSSNEVPWTLEY